MTGPRFVRDESAERLLDAIRNQPPLTFIERVVVLLSDGLWWLVQRRVDRRRHLRTWWAEDE